MVAMLKQEIEIITKKYQIELINPFANYNYRKIIKDNFFNGKYFNDGLYDKGYVAGDANVFPFWCKIFDIQKDNEARRMFSSSLTAIQKDNLDKPFPLKYTNIEMKGKRLFLQNLCSQNYEGNTIWMHLGLCYLDVIAEYEKSDKEIDKSKKEMHKKYLLLYGQNTISAHNFLEVYNTDGSIYKTLLYQTDEGMLWAAKYLSQLI
jgi:hypothetical protein